MKLCRFNKDRLGLVEGRRVYDVSSVLSRLQPELWPGSWGDPVIRDLAELWPEIESVKRSAPWSACEAVTLYAPVARPSKVIAAPLNYEQHLRESRLDQEINFGTDVKRIDHYGLFLKASSSVVGPGEGISLRLEERRNDHEIELVAVIGRHANRVPRREAYRYIAGYCIGLDITVRGTEDRSFRKSVDSYTVIGPWLTTADEISDPKNLDLELRVNQQIRQRSNTRHLIFDVPRLVEYASSMYTLYPGDLIMTGTPEGVGPIVRGDRLTARIQDIGTMSVEVRGEQN